MCDICPPNISKIAEQIQEELIDQGKFIALNDIELVLYRYVGQIIFDSYDNNK